MICRYVEQLERGRGIITRFYGLRSSRARIHADLQLCKYMYLQNKERPLREHNYPGEESLLIIHDQDSWMAEGNQ